MLIINPSHEILMMAIDPSVIENAGRTCYKSSPKGEPENFIRMIKSRGHDSVLEHSMLTVKFITNRGVSHELVRHRLASFSQESTRYVNYEKKGLVVIRPVWLSEQLLGENPRAGMTQAGVPIIIPAESVWLDAMYWAEASYNKLIELGWRPEQAREVLPNSTKTGIVVSANAREWRHILRLRTAKVAHPEMRRLMIPLLRDLKIGAGAVLFEDIEIEESVETK